MEGCLSLLLLLLRFQVVAGERVEERDSGGGSAAQGKVQRAVEINNCLHNAPDVGCDAFECLENSTCELHNLYDICRLFLQNAGSFNSQGKQFIKDFLKCNAIGIKSRFSCSICRCPAIQEILSELQEACYQKHNICAVANNNVDAFAEMIDLHDMLLNGAYLEFVKVLIDCDAGIADAIRRSIQSRFGSKLGILRQMLQDDSCSTAEKATLESTMEAQKVRRGSDNTPRGEHWHHKHQNQ